MSPQRQTDRHEEPTHHAYQPPLSSLIHPHLHSLLVIAAEHGLSEPAWSAGKPEEKRSESSDKTITPSSSSTFRASSSHSHCGEEKSQASAASQHSSLPKHVAVHSPALSGRQASPTASRRSSESGRSSTPAALLAEASQPMTLMLSPAAERSQTDLIASAARRSSRESSPASQVSNKGASARDHKAQDTGGRPKTDNELWVQAADCVKVVADALREDQLRGPLGKTSFVLHLLTLFSLTMTHDKASSAPASRQNAAQAQRQHARGSSSDSSASDAAARLDGMKMAQIQCLRGLANLCIDNHDNRSDLIAHDVPLFILRLINNILASPPPTNEQYFDTQTLLLLKTAMGALLNLQLDHSDSRRWLLKLPPAGSRRFAHQTNGGTEKVVTEENHQAAHPEHLHLLHRPSDPHQAEGGGGLFDMPEAGTILTLIEVLSDPRIYSPASALRSILGQNRPEKGQKDWQPPSGQWEQAELGAEVASWAASIAEDLLAFESEEAKAAQGGGDDIDLSMLTLPSKVALASHPQAWMWLSRSIEGFMPVQGKLSQPSPPSLHEPDSDGPEDATTFLDADLTILSLCGDLLEACANIYQGNAPAAAKFKRNGLPHLDNLLTFIEKGTSPFGTNATPPAGLLEQYGLDVDDVSMMAKEVSRAKSNAVKAVISLVGEDANMSELFGDGGHSPFLKKMKSWLQMDRSKREDLVSCALLSIANLARSDANCISLVTEHDLVPLLLSLLQGKVSMLLSHAALGLLKNLCIPVPNKTVIGASGIFAFLPTYLLKEKDHAQPIQFAAVGVCKHLAYCSSGGLEKNVAALCESEGASEASTLDAILALIERTEDTPTRLEATRVLVNVIRTLCASSKKDAMKVTTDEVDLSDVRTKIGEKRVIEALCDMLRRGGRYPILLNEAIVGLTLLASCASSDQAATIARTILRREGTGGANGDCTTVEGEGKQVTSSSAEANARDLLKRAPPARSSTMDSMISTCSSATVTAPFETAADVLYRILVQAASSPDGLDPAEDISTRGREIPIEFAENTCTLLSTLVEGSQVCKGQEGKDLSIKLLPALRGLKSRTADSERESTTKAVARALASSEGAIEQDEEE